MSAVFQVVDQWQVKGKEDSDSYHPKSSKVKCRKWLRPVTSIILIMTGYILFVLSYFMMEESPLEVRRAVCLAIVGTVCVSLNWWENYSRLFTFLEDIAKDVANSQNVVCILSSVVKVLVTAAVIGGCVPMSEWSSLKVIPISVTKIVFGLMAIQIASSAMCRWFVVVACKMHALRRCFVVPMCLSSVTALLLYITLFFPLDQYPNSNCTQSTNVSFDNQTMITTISTMSVMTDIMCTLYLRRIVSQMDVGGLVVLGMCALSWWLGLMLSTAYIWFLKIHRIERTQDLFVKQMFEGAFLEQSMLLNTRFATMEKKKNDR